MDFFGDKARKGLDFLKSRAKETVEAQKLVSGIRALEDQRDRCLMDIGHRVVAMFETESFDRQALRDLAEEAKRIHAELEVQTEIYQKVKEQLKQSVEEILPKGEQRSDDL